MPHDEHLIGSSQALAEVISPCGRSKGSQEKKAGEGSDEASVQQSGHG
ncbi:MULTISPECIES: hypothetical protein [Herbaspirillum]|uniref:Uncharacterized protein n=1 Tax=Herbaspirillum frisingense TaxID=92645 RepID=A0ABU1P9J5_9BURK|nr:MULTISPECIES: hypothetical protein [Herbaspirillum]MDR6582584.1 hypothetical protein [Herbaspirillum frisingense]